MKNFISLWLSHYRWARRYCGGHWIRPRKDDSFFAWVTFSPKEVSEVGRDTLQKCFVYEDWSK